MEKSAVLTTDQWPTKLEAAQVSILSLHLNPDTKQGLVTWLQRLFLASTPMTEKKFLKLHDEKVILLHTPNKLLPRKEKLLWDSYVNEKP